MIIMKEKVLAILKEIRPDIDFENEKALITDGLLVSYDIVSIVGELNDEFDIAIGVDELEPENFDSVDAMVDLIKELED